MSTPLEFTACFSREVRDSEGKTFVSLSVKYQVEPLKTLESQVNQASIDVASQVYRQLQANGAITRSECESRIAKLMGHEQVETPPALPPANDAKPTVVGVDDLDFSDILNR